MIQSCIKAWLVLSIILLAGVPSFGLTKATLTGQVYSATFDGDPSCVPGPIVVRAGVYDFSAFLKYLKTPLDENAAWPDSLPWLEPAFPGLLFADTLTIQGVDVATTPSGTPYEMDISPLAEWCGAHNPDGKPLGFIFLTIGGEGKINLFSDESFATHDTSRLLGITLETEGGKKAFRYDPRTWKSKTGRIQYTGHNRQNIRYKNAAFVIGGHHKRLPDGTYVNKDRCAFIFHRGLAGAFGWNDTYYDTIKPALLSFSVRDRTPTSASILILTDKETRALVTWGTGSPGQAVEQEAFDLTHQVTLAPLSDTTKYFFQAFLTDTSGNSLIVPRDSFLTLAKHPKVTGIAVSGTTENSATLGWKTAALSKCRILFGLEGHINTYVETAVSDTVHTLLLRSLLPARSYEFIIVATDARGLTDTSAVNRFTTLSGISAERNEASSGLLRGLSQNRPNPFTGSTTFRYRVPEGSRGRQAKIIMMNASGQILYKTDCVSTPGVHSFTWKPAGLRSGVIYAELLLGEERINKKRLIYLK